MLFQKAIGVGKAFLGCLSAVVILTVSAQAQSFPDRTVTIVVPFPPGGLTDGFARATGELLQKRWGQPVVVENRPGGGAAIGTDSVVKSRPDGYTLLLGASYLAVAPNLFPNLQYNPKTDLKAIGVGIANPLALFASPEMNVKTGDELKAKLIADGDKYNFASAGNGTLAHIGAELYQSQSGTKLTHIAYQGTAPALLDVIGGRAQLIIESVTAGMPYVKSGQLVPIMVTGAERSALLTDTPTSVESGMPELIVESWNTFFVPANTPDEVVKKLNEDIAAVLNDDASKAWIAERGQRIIISTPEAFGEALNQEIDKWGGVIKQAGITVQ